MPRYGIEKLDFNIKDKLTERNFKIERIGFVEFYRHQNLLGTKIRRSSITTDYNDRYLKSTMLIKELATAHAALVFVSDITYIKLDKRHSYLALVTDLYSKK